MVQRFFPPNTCFNPRVPCGTRREEIAALLQLTQFQSTRPVRDATVWNRIFGWCLIRFNPRVPCGTRRSGSKIFSAQYLFQSTRPVRDATLIASINVIFICVSIHASRAGRDLQPQSRQFQPARFNPRVPCGTRRDWTVEDYVKWLVSIHASRAGRDIRFGFI